MLMNWFLGNRMLAEENTANRADHFDSVTRTTPVITVETVRQFLETDLIYKGFPEANRIYFTPQGLKTAETEFRTLLTVVGGKLLILYGCRSDSRRLTAWVSQAKCAGASPFSCALVPPEPAHLSWMAS
jgi:hypothetical protein